MKCSVWYFHQAQNLIRYKDLVSVAWDKNIAITLMLVGVFRRTRIVEIPFCSYCSFKKLVICTLE